MIGNQRRINERAEGKNTIWNKGRTKRRVQGSFEKKLKKGTYIKNKIKGNRKCKMIIESLNFKKACK